MSRRAALFAAGLTVLMAAGCSGGGNQTSSPAPSPTTIRSSSTTTEASDPSATTAVGPSEPDGTDEPAVTPVLQLLMDRYDAAVAAILADPRVASDSESPTVTAYLALFADGDFGEGALTSWAREGQNGRFYRPGPRGELTDSTVVDLTSTAADEVTFRICAVNSIEITDASGAVIESQGGQTAATVVAVRVDGAWKLRDLTEASTAGCPEAGG